MMERGGSEARAQLKRLATIVAGQSPSSETVYPLEECPTCLPFIQGSAEFGPRFPHPRYACPQSPKRCQPQDLLLSVRAPVGDLNQAEAELGIGRGVAAVRSDKLLHGYLWYVLEAFGQQLDAVARGSTYASIGAEDIGRLEIPYPHKEEQRRIADYLDRETQRIDALVEKNNHLANLVHERALSAVAETVSARGVGEESSQHQTAFWIGSLPSSWVVAPLNQRYEVQLGKMLSGERASGGSQRPYLANVDVQWGSINVEGLRTMAFADDEWLRYGVEPGDVLICEGGEIGRAAMWPNSGPQGVYFQKALHRARPRSSDLDNPRWLYHLLYVAAKTGVFSFGAEKATIEHLTGERLRSHRFPFPPKREQDRLVERLDTAIAEVEGLVGQLEAQNALLRERRRALITAAVTGEVEVGEAV